MGWKAKRPLHSFVNRKSKFKMRKTVALGFKAILSAFTDCEADRGEIYIDVKDSGFMEKSLGQKVLMDSYMKEIVRAHNMASTAREKIQILSLVSKMGFGRLKKFNPPNVKEAESDDEDDTDIDM